jgi:hypothetical protein
MLYLGLPQWADYLIKGLLIFATLASSAVILSRTGRSPYLAFLMLPLPYLQIAALWLFAWSLWRERKKAAQASLPR